MRSAWIAMSGKISLQRQHALQNGTFAKTFDVIAGEYGSLKGGDTVITDGYQYKLTFLSDDLSLIGAKPLEEGLNGYNGAVLIYKNKKGILVAETIICKSNSVGADGTNPANAPIRSSSGKLSCALGWTVRDRTGTDQT
jgi:Type IV pilin-like G and H, putative